MTKGMKMQKTAMSDDVNVLRVINLCIMFDHSSKLCQYANQTFLAVLGGPIISIQVDPVALGQSCSGLPSCLCFGRKIEMSAGVGFSNLTIDIQNSSCASTCRLRLQPEVHDSSRIRPSRTYP